MKKFIVLYTAPKGSWKGMKSASPDEMKKGMESWMAWAKKCGNGLVDMGTPLGNGQKVTMSGGKLSDKSIIGYSVLQAENMKAAEDMLKGHPHLAWAEGCNIEVYESMPMPA